MIANKYLGEFRPEMELATVDLYCLWRMNQYLRGILPQAGYEKGAEWIQRRYIYRMVKKETGKYLSETYDRRSLPLFSSIEIETVNRCNGECPFCPVNRRTDPRPLKKMEEGLFYKIIDELGELDYSGRLALHSNNEPFLDNRIIEFAKYAREHVPNAFVYLYTNGTLVTLDKFKAIMPYLDRMVIDNYDDEFKLHENVQRIHNYCRKDRKLDKKTEIRMRKVHEVLNTRGGQSPNNDKKETLRMSCILPYKQMVVRPDGRTSLCCNDPYGTNTLADLNKMTLEEAWYSKRYEMVRRTLRKGRKYINRCLYCDTLPSPKGC